MDRLQLDERADLILAFRQPFDGFRKGHRHSDDVFAEQLFKWIQNPSVDHFWAGRSAQAARKNQPDQPLDPNLPFGRFKALRLLVGGVRLKQQCELRQQLDWIDFPDELLELLHDAWQPTSRVPGKPNEIGNGLGVFRRKRARHMPVRLSRKAHGALDPFTGSRSGRRRHWCARRNGGLIMQHEAHPWSVAQWRTALHATHASRRGRAAGRRTVRLARAGVTLERERSDSSPRLRSA